MQSYILKSILNLPARQMRRLRLMWTPKRIRRKCGKFSRDELLDYMRKNNIRSRRKLDVYRKDGDPLPSTYSGEFGSWGAALKAAFGSPIVKPSLDKEYVVKSALMMGIITYNQYVEARKKNPDILPSIWAVLKMFGSFARFASNVRALSFKETMDAYSRLWRRLGKAPSFTECKRAGINLDIMIIKVFLTKKSLDSYMQDVIDGIRKQWGGR